MATVKPGIVGYFTGKIGEVVLSRWKDINVGKNTPRKSTKEASLEQKDQRLRFGVVTKFLGNLSDVIRFGYQSESPIRTKMNDAVSYHLDNAVTGVYPNYAIDYTKVSLSDPNSKQTIDSGLAPKAQPIADATIEITWQIFDRATGITLPTDRLYLIFYSLNRNKFILYNGVAARSELSYKAELPRIFTGDKLQGYMFFVSEKGKASSYTDNLGQFTVLP